MSLVKNLTCINCPLGCDIDIEINGNEILSISGNQCIKGKIYAEEEATNPTRILTTTLTVTGSKIKAVSVKTEKPVAKKYIMEIMHELTQIRVKAPIKIGDVLVENILGKKINLIATKNIE